MFDGSASKVNDRQTSPSQGVTAVDGVTWQDLQTLSADASQSVSPDPLLLAGK